MEINYDNIGNVRKNYENVVPRIVTPAGLVTSPLLVLKMYSMLKKSPVKWGDITNAKKFLTKEIREGKIEPLIGMGFAILSEDILNVGKWDYEEPIVLKNQLYTFSNYSKKELDILDFKNNFDSAKPLDIREVGNFCVYELNIVNHEKKSWEKYLKSDFSKEAKKRYLEDLVIIGGL